MARVPKFFHLDLGGSLDYLFVFNDGNITQQETCDLDLEETLLTARLASLARRSHDQEVVN